MPLDSPAISRLASCGSLGRSLLEQHDPRANQQGQEHPLKRTRARRYRVIPYARAHVALV